MATGNNGGVAVITDATTVVPLLASSLTTATGADTGLVVNTTTTAEDFNADGKSDLLLQYSTGVIVIETQANLGVTNGFNVGNPGPTWHLVASADFNGDFQPDLLLQNDDSTIVEYLMNGTTISAGYSFGTPGAGWHVRGTGDFNADGKADIVLQNDNGGIVIYNTNGTAVSAAAYVTNPGAGWTVAGVADLNGDGNADILVQNTNGQIVDYLMNGDAVLSANYLGSPGVGWAVAGTGDYNGDGKADLLLHNDNGADVIWETNGLAVTGQVYVGNPGASYTGAVTGVDLNGDGATDLVLQNSSSALVGFTLNSAATITAGASLGTPGPGWTAIGNDPMQFIDGSASANGATLAATVGADQFNFTSFIGGLHMISGFDPAQDAVALSQATFATYAAVQANEVAYQGGTFIALTPGTTGRRPRHPGRDAGPTLGEQLRPALKEATPSRSALGDRADKPAPQARSGPCRNSPHGRIPWRGRTVSTPSPIRREGQHEPDRDAEARRQVGHGRVDGNDHVELPDRGGPSRRNP